jgi:hypothetical protein
MNEMKMKQVCLRSCARTLIVIFCIGCVPPMIAPAQTRSVTDHLVPPLGSIDAHYKKVLERKLFLSPGDYGRVLFTFGGNEGEYAVSIHPKKQSDKEASMSCTRAQRNLGDATWELNPDRVGEKAVKVERTDVSIPKPVAISTSHAFLEMLQRTRERDINPDGEQPVFGGVNIEFSIKDSAGKVLEGVLTAEMKGEHVLCLKRIADLLAQYCEASPDQRLELAKRLQREANQLLDNRAVGQRRGLK